MKPICGGMFALTETDGSDAQSLPGYEMRLFILYLFLVGVALGAAWLCIHRLELILQRTTPVE